MAGRIKDLHDEEGLLEVDFTPFQMNNKTLLSGKCQPGWTLLDSTCYMYHGGPMTFRYGLRLVLGLGSKIRVWVGFRYQNSRV